MTRQEAEQIQRHSDVSIMDKSMKLYARPKCKCGAGMKYRAYEVYECPVCHKTTVPNSKTDWGVFHNVK